MDFNQIRFTILLCLSPLLGQAQIPQWTTTFGASGDQTVLAMDIDPFKNIYVIGTFEDTLSFSNETKNVHLVSKGMQDLYISKFDSNGVFLWSKSIGGGRLDVANAVVANPQGGCFVAGVYWGNVDFNPGGAPEILSSNGSSYDPFIMKLDDNGNLQWVKTFGGSGTENALALTLTPKGKLVISGFFEYWVDFDPAVGEHNIRAKGGLDAYFLQLDSSGIFNWVVTAGGPSASSSKPDLGYGTAINEQGELFAVGSFSDSVIFPGNTKLVSKGSSDIFIMLLDSSGNSKWVQQIGGPGKEEARDIVFNGNESAIITGFTNDTLSYLDSFGIEKRLPSQGYFDILLFEINEKGKFDWVKSYGGKGGDWGLSTTIDSDQNILCTGYMSDSVSFDPGNKNALQIANASTDAFVLCLDKKGDYKWSTNIGNRSSAEGRCISADDRNQIYYNGVFTGSFDFDYTNKLDVHSSKGMRDGFIQKIVPCNHSRDTFYMESCKDFISPSGKYIWTQNGTYFDTTNVYGCDSFYEIHLAFKPLDEQNISVSNCLSYTSPSGKHIWTNSGKYRDTLLSAAGCDSIINIDLEIIGPIQTSIFVKECTAYLSPSKKYTWTSDGIYRDTLLASSGCDSVMVVNLDILGPSYELIDIASCDPFVSPSKKYLWDTSGIYLDTLLTSFGCDSFITIHLLFPNFDTSVVLSSDSLISSDIDCAYQWLNCNDEMKAIKDADKSYYIPTKTGRYAVQIEKLGCRDTSSCHFVKVKNTSNRIFPNPFYDAIYIDIDLGDYSSYQLKIYDMAAQLIDEFKLTKSGLHQIKTDYYPAGMYLFVLEIGDGRLVTRGVRMF